MKPVALIGIVLIVLGVAVLAYGGLSYRTRETVVDIGPIEATAERERTILQSPIFGIAGIVGGLVLVAAGMRKRA
jgi:drug/metabolite transporter (DMT)-like permease